MRNSHRDLVNAQGRPMFMGAQHVAGRKNLYSKRDYEIFARVLKDAKPMTTATNDDPANRTWACVVAGIAELFKEDNERFDKLTFIKRIHEHEQLPLDTGSTP